MVKSSFKILEASFLSNSVYRPRTERCVTWNCGDSNELGESAILPQISPLSGDPRSCIHGVNAIILLQTHCHDLHSTSLADFVESELSLVILYLYLEVIATESPIAPNDSLCAPKQHTKSRPKSTWGKNGKFTKTLVTNLHNFKMAVCFCFL